MINPPTDSLYKFVAISGLVILIWGVSFPWKKSFDLRVDIAEIQSKIEKAQSKAEPLDSQMEALVDERERLSKSMKTKEAEARIVAIDNEKLELYAKLLEIKAPISEKIEVVPVLRDGVTTYSYVGWTAILFGASLSGAGFVLWFFRIQRHIDKKIANDSNEA